MRILVTGGAGFIGNHLCRYLVRQGHKVTCVDNLWSGNYENIKDLIDDNLFSFINIDITDPDFLKIMKTIVVDQIYHLACPSSPKFYRTDPIKLIKTCVSGTINVLEYALLHNSRILFASTSEVYGDPLEHPQKETYFGNVNTIGIRSCYNEGKRLGETLMTEYYRLYGVNVRIVRMFNTYGPGMTSNDGKVVSNFIDKALRCDNITIYGSGKQTRSLCYIDDMIQGLLVVMSSSVTIPVNIGSPDEYDINCLADQIIKLTKSKSEKQYIPPVKDDPAMRCPDISTANDIGWFPCVGLEQGLLETIRRFH